MMAHLLEAANVVEMFGGLKAISDFNIYLDPGEMVGLIGPNGAGKTTAFNLFTGVYQPTRGTITFDGRSIVGLKPYEITQRGVGNGTSLIIFAGIVSAIPRAIGGTVNLVNTGDMNFLILALIIAIILITIGVIIYIELGERRIPISFSRKVLMANQNKRIMNYVPIKLNLSGVIPPIFASAILMFPTTILQASTNPIIQKIHDFLSPSNYFFNFLTFVLVIFFAYFYASIAFNSKDISENLKKQGGFIPGIRPGEGTASFLNEVASRLTFWGSIYLGLVTVIPWLLVKFMGVPFYFGGTSVLIVVSVALDTMRRIEAQIYMNKYQTLSAVGL